MNTTLPAILEEALELKQMKLGLERMKACDAALGFPSRAFSSIHIAGTNGKGSVATKIASALPGKKVGLFTSPHIESYRERVQINGNWISETKAAFLLNRIMQTVPEQPTYFELLTLLALTHFAEEKVDFAVMEVGMGGRLDATNIVTPILSVITSIGLDHTQYLGETLEEIAREKGGIIKPGIPVVVGPNACYYPGAIEVAGTFSHYEEENEAIARRALEVLGIRANGLSAVPPCRFEQIGKVILDVAHNPDGLRRAFERIAYTYPHQKVRVLAAFSADKDRAACLEVIRRHADAFHLVHVSHPRIENPPEALPLAQAFACAQPDELILVCGTFFLMADVKAYLQAERST